MFRIVGPSLLALLTLQPVFAEDRILLEAANGDPDSLPTLGVWQEYAKNKDTYYTYVSASFPNVPEFICDMWCYESEGIHYQSTRELGQGAVELRHSWDDHDWDIVTTAIPRNGAVEIVAGLESTENKTSDSPEEYPSLNICWQLRRAKGFSSEKNRYPEFVERCFIFTDRGRIFLHNTRRRPIPVRSSTDERNNPPWVQMYLPTSAPDDKRAGAEAWADFSPDRYAYPLIGAVSKDEKFLTAMAAGAEKILSQAWHDCMHNNPGWLPAEGGTGKHWRVQIYVMENNPHALIRQFQKDFPHVDPWQSN